MFDGGSQTPAPAAAAPTPLGTPTATTDPRDALNITACCSCAHQQKQQQHQSRKEETKSDRRWIRVCTSLPNYALPQEPNAEVRHDEATASAEEAVAEVPEATSLFPRNKQRHKGEAAYVADGTVVGKVKSREAQPEQQPNNNHHHPHQHMAFFGTVRETVEFLRGTIGRSRRKGADLATGGGRDLAQRGGGPGANNGVCPVPDTNGPPACTSLAQQKKTSGSAQSARKTIHHQSVDNCVADSVDDQMLDKLCTSPRGLDRHEWLASHVLALFEHVNCISATLSEVCTPTSCSTMSFPGNSKAQWVDERGKRHNYSAMRYIDSVMALCEASRKNQTLFPTKYGAAFGTEFEQHCARMVRLLWHCAGHAYAKHWEHLNGLNLRLQFGLVLAHMAKLAKLHALLADKELNSLMHTLQLARPSSSSCATTTTTTASTSDGCGSNAAAGCDQQQQQSPMTVVAAAAVVQQQPPQQHRPTKRALLDDSSTTTTGTAKTVASAGEAAVQQQQKKKTAQKRATTKKEDQPQQHCTLKSGSWSGHSAAVALASVVAAAPTATVTDYDGSNNDAMVAKKNCQQQQQQKCCCAQTC